MQATKFEFALLSLGTRFVIPRIMEIESLTYEPARRDPQEVLELAFNRALGVAVVAELKTEEN